MYGVRENECMEYVGMGLWSTCEWVYGVRGNVCMEYV